MHLKSNGLNRGLKVSKVAEKTGSGNRSPVRKIFLFWMHRLTVVLGFLFIYLGFGNS